MPTYEITAPDGRVFEVTGDGTKEDALAHIQSTYTPKEAEAKYSPLSDSPVENFLAGAGKGFVDIGRGVKDAVIDLAGTDAQKAASDAEIKASRERDAALMDSGAGIAGNITGTVAGLLPTAFIPGANTVAGGAAIGAGTGLLMPALEGERATNAMTGAGFGAGGALLGKGASRVLNPRGSEAAQGLLEADVALTPGQAAGGAAKRAEDALTSLPGVGDMIKTGQRGAVEDWNRSLGNRVLSNIGEELPEDVPAGHEMVKHIGDTLSRAYDDLMPDLTVVSDDMFKKDIDSLLSMVDDLEDGGKQARSIIEKTMLRRMSPNGGMAGETLKEVESALGEVASKYRKSLDVNQSRLGDALTEAQAALRRLVARSNPDARETLRGLNKGWAELVRLEKAAGMSGSKEGVFSPAALNSAVKAADRSTRKRAVGRGTALLQDEAKAAESVLGPTVPDSGTAGRGLTAGLLAGLYDPSMIAAMATLGAGYGTKAGRQGLLAATAKRPESLRAAGRGVESLLRYAPAAGVGLLPTY